MDPVTLIDLGLSMFAASFLVEDEETEEENCFVWEFDSEEWDYLLTKISTTVTTPRNVHFITQRWADIFLVFSSICFRYSCWCTITLSSWLKKLFVFSGTHFKNWKPAMSEGLFHIRPLKIEVKNYYKTPTSWLELIVADINAVMKPFTDYEKKPASEGDAARK